MGIDDVLARLREARGISTASKAAQEATEPKGGMLRGLFNYLDLPGNIIQNILLKGNFEGAGRNLIDLATKSAGLGLVGLDTDLSREQDRPDVGLVGEILLDPLTWVSFGGAGALKVPQLAGKAALKATSKSLTRTGLKAVAGQAAKLAATKTFRARAAKEAAKLVAGGVAKKAAEEAAELGVKKLASRIVTRQVTRGLQKGSIPEFLKSVTRPLQTGGIQVGLPFTTGKTVALEGTDVIKEGLKYTLPGLAARGVAKIAPQKTAKLVDGLKGIVKKFAPAAFATPEGQSIIRRSQDLYGKLKSSYDQRLVAALSPIDEALRVKMTKAIGTADPEKSVAKLLQSIPDPQQKELVARGLGEWQNLTKEWADALESQGFLYDRSKLKAWYVPKQLKREGPGSILEAIGAAPEKGARPSTKPSKFFLEPSTLDDISKLDDAELDLLKVGMNRAHDQADLISVARGVRQANAVSTAIPVENIGRFVAGAPSVTPEQRLRSGTLMSRLSEVDPRLGRRVEQPVEQVVKANIPAARAVQAPAQFRPDPSMGFGRRVQQFDATRRAAAQAKNQYNRRLRSVVKATEEFIPKKQAKRLAVDMPDVVGGDPGKITFGFKNKAGEYTSKATLVKAADGAYELHDLPKMPVGDYKYSKSMSKKVNALTAAAYRVGAEQGLNVRVSNSAFQRFRPRLNNLMDESLESYFKNRLGKIKSSPVIDWLNNNKWMKTFRASATVGLGPLINPAFHTRNIITATALQAFSDPQMGLAGFKHVRPLVEGLIDKVGRKAGVKIKGSPVFKMLAEDAIQQGRNIGRTVSHIDDVRYGSYTGREILKLAQDNAVIRQGYTGIEDALQAAEKAKKIFPQWGHEAGEYAENVFRLNAFAELLGKGVHHEEAAKAVSRMFVDYRYQSNADKAVRSLFPFSRFTLAQTPVTLETIARNPRMTHPLRALMAGSTDAVVPPWLADSPNIPIGETEEGKKRYLSRLGLPFEDLSTLGGGEGMARTLEQGVLGRLNPFLRIPLELTTNRSFFKGENLGKSTRAPAAFPDFMVQALGGKVNPQEKGGRRLPWEADMLFRNMPVSRQVNEISKIMDERKSVWARSLDFIAGVKMHDIDEDVELRRMIRDYLGERAQRGDLGTVERFFSYGDTDETLTQLIKDYYKIGKSSGKRRAQPPEKATPKS